LLTGTVGVTRNVYEVIAALIVEAGVTRTDLMKGTLVIFRVKPDSKISMILPSKVMVCILKVSVVSNVRGFTIPGITNV
jgi:hypothetical protein